jgi:hypothetical protein
MSETGGLSIYNFDSVKVIVEYLSQQRTHYHRSFIIEILRFVALDFRESVQKLCAVEDV